MITSYAQNFEDVILWRALKTIESGRYIDVGAAHPVADSVTRLFYDHGWTGVNVEPDPTLFPELIADRPRDTNLSVAVGAEHGELIFNVSSHPGLSTLDEGVARRHAAESINMTKTTVAVITLAELIDEHLPTGDIHFLKIDTEGNELDVIRGGDWVRHRPWIVVVETAGQQIPGEQRDASELTITDECISEALTERGYLSAYSDGLNQFFVANEHSELIQRIAIPPNVFDRFVRLSEMAAEDRRQAMERQAEDAELRLIAMNSSFSQRLAETAASLAEANARAATAEDSARVARVGNAALETALQNMTKSLSWRITTPLRWVARCLRRSGG